MMKGIVKAKKSSSLAKNKAAAAGQPSLEQFIFSRDYTGALALLEFRLKCQDGDTKDLLLWIGYCSFHLGNFKRAEDAYKELLDAHDVGREIYLYIAACYFFQQMYDESEKEAFKGSDSSLKVRLLFNIAHRTADEAKLMEYHRQLQDKKDDQLSLAAVHYLRSHHQEVRVASPSIAARRYRSFYSLTHRQRIYTKDCCSKIERISRSMSTLRCATTSSTTMMCRSRSWQCICSLIRRAQSE